MKKPVRKQINEEEMNPDCECCFSVNSLTHHIMITESVRHIKLNMSLTSKLFCIVLTAFLLFLLSSSSFSSGLLFSPFCLASDVFLRCFTSLLCMFETADKSLLKLYLCEYRAIFLKTKVIICYMIVASFKSLQMLNSPRTQQHRPSASERVS